MKEAKRTARSAEKAHWKLIEGCECLDSLHKMMEKNSVREACIEKRSAYWNFSSWDYQRMAAVEAETYGKSLAVKNLKCFIIFRAEAIQKELRLGCSWKAFFKKMWCWILGKSYPWELACKELIQALKKGHHFETLKTEEEGWGKDFDKKLASLLAQPH